MWCGRETLLPLIADLECSFAVLQLSCTHCVALLRTLFFCSTVGGAHRAAPSWRSTATCCKRRCCSAVPWHGTTHGRPAPNFGLLRKGLLDCHSSTRALGRALPVAIGTHVPWPRRRCGRIPFAAARQTLSQLREISARSELEVTAYRQVRRPEARPSSASVHRANVRGAQGVRLAGRASHTRRLRCRSEPSWAFQGIQALGFSALAGSSGGPELA